MITRALCLLSPSLTLSNLVWTKTWGMPPCPRPPLLASISSTAMSFVFEFLQHSWAQKIRSSDAEDLKNWQGFLDSKEKDRQRE